MTPLLKLYSKYREGIFVVVVLTVLATCSVKITAIKHTFDIGSCYKEDYNRVDKYVEVISEGDHGYYVKVYGVKDDPYRGYVLTRDVDDYAAIDCHHKNKRKGNYEGY